MILIDDPVAHAAQFLETPFDAIAVKKIGFDLATLPANEKNCGKLSVPTILFTEVASNAELYDAIRASGVPEVVVVGHGWGGIDSEVFVWKGTPDEFQEMWEGD